VKYTVTFTPFAERRLGHIYDAASDKRAVQEAADLIERWLKDRPLHGDLDTQSGLREFEAGPLKMLFRVSEEDRLVTVLGVRRID
jgi:plasmid stabilization system protein ParE